MRKTEGVSLQNGFTRIANELLEAIIRMPFTTSERRFVLALIRLTYGYGVSKKAISRRLLMRIAHIPYTRHFNRIKSKLIRESVIKVDVPERPHKAITYAIKKDYNNWKVVAIQRPRPQVVAMERPQSGRHGASPIPTKESKENYKEKPPAQIIINNYQNVGAKSRDTSSEFLESIKGKKRWSNLHTQEKE